MAITIHFDGACEPVNPGGVAAYGFLVKEHGRTIHEGFGLAAAPGPGATNNVGEYRGLVEGLRWLVANGHTQDDIIVRGDSQLIIRQVTGEYKVRNDKLLPLYREVAALLPKFAKKPKFEWVPREQNERADELSKEGVRVALLEHPEWTHLKGAPQRLRLEDPDARSRRGPARPARAPSVAGAPADKATQKQLDYLRALGVTRPEGLTKRDASRMIDEAKGKGKGNAR